MWGNVIMSVGNNDGNTLVDQEYLEQLIAEAMALSERALKAGQPQASALLTLAVSDLRKSAA